MATINIALDYSKTPGGRYKNEGRYSGEEFRETMLKPRYETAQRDGERLEIILDGGYGYGSSFLEEAFGGLVREIPNLDISIFDIVSDEEPQLVNDIMDYMKNANKNSRRTAK